MKNTKEEIMKETAEIIYKTLNRGQEQNSASIINAIEQRINDCINTLKFKQSEQSANDEMQDDYIYDIYGTCLNNTRWLETIKQKFKITRL